MNFISQMEKQIVLEPKIESRLDITWSDLYAQEQNLILAAANLLNVAKKNRTCVAELFEVLENAKVPADLIPCSCCASKPEATEGMTRLSIFSTLNKEDQSAAIANSLLFIFDMFKNEIIDYKLAKLGADKAACCCATAKALGLCEADLDPHEKNFLLGMCGVMIGATPAEIFEQLESAKTLQDILPYSATKPSAENIVGITRMNIFFALTKEEQSAILADCKLYIFDLFQDEIIARKLGK